MNLRLTCTQAQYEALTKAVHTGRRRHVAVHRASLKALLVDQVRLRKMAGRTADIVEPGGNHELSPADKRLMARGKE